MAKETGSTRKCGQKFQDADLHFVVKVTEQWSWPLEEACAPSVSQLKARSQNHPPAVCDVVDEFRTAEKIRSLTPGVPHISKTMAVFTSLIIDKGSSTSVIFMFNYREIILVHYADVVSMGCWV